MKIIFIVPYYGKFPSYFNIFLKSCANNPDYKWLIISDNKQNYAFPDNVQYKNLPWCELQNLFRSKFDFEISLETPYKLCDFKPAYGYLFQEYIKDYDYWGYCDIDLIFGDLKSFLPEGEIKKFDKVGHLGHMTIYRNTNEINQLFMSTIDGYVQYREVFSSNRIFVFDEWGERSINHIFVDKRKKVWMFNEYFDVYPYDDNFKKVVRKIPDKKQSYGKDIIEKEISFGYIENGKSFQLSYKKGVRHRNEVAYIHLQKRSMEVLANDLATKYLLIPDKIISTEDGYVPKKYLWKANFHRLFNIRKFEWEAKKLIYWFVEKTSPIRHPFRKHNEYL